MSSAFFFFEIILGFTSTFVAVCYATSYTFGFTSKSKFAPLDILKFLVAALRNQDNKAVFIRVDKYGALERSSEFIKTCHNMNIIVQTTGGYESSLNGKSESPNKTLDNITRALPLKSSHKKELWCFAYQYATWISCQNDNILSGDVTYFTWHLPRPLYKHIIIWCVRVYIINVHVTRKKLDNRSHCGYFMVYTATTGVIIYWNTDQPFFIHIDHNFWFDEYNYRLSIEYNHTPFYLLVQQGPESHIRDSDFLKLIPCEIYLTCTPFSDTTIIAY